MKKFLLIALAALLVMTSAIALAETTECNIHTPAIKDGKEVILSTVEATCLTEGYTVYECATCKDPYKVKTADKLDHVKATEKAEDYVEATCTTDAYYVFTCKVCKEKFNVIDEAHKATGHALVEDKKLSIPATCTKDGVIAWYCKNEGCKYTTTTKGESKFEHKLEDGAAAWKTFTKTVTPATCAQAGLDIEYTYCTKCGTYDDKLNKEIVVAKIKHDLAAEYIVWKYEKDGKTISVDANGNKIVAEVLKKKGDAAVTDKYATYDEQLKFVKDVTYTKVGAETVAYKAATCTTDGSITVKCALCNAEVAGVLKATDHKWVVDGNKSTVTCTKDGYTVFVCANGCGEIKQVATKALGHDFTNGKVHYYQQLANKAAIVEVESLVTCIDGYKATQCIRCDVLTEKKLVKATTKHNEIATVVTKKATCLENGQYIYQCDDCLYNYVGVIKAAGKHTAALVKVTKEATCTTAGEKTMKCTFAGDREHEKCTATWTETIPALGHTQWVVDTKKSEKATCTKDGKTVEVCLQCGEEKVTPIKAGHKIGDNDVLAGKDPSCFEAGWQSFYCEVCHELVKSQEIAVRKHVWDAGTYTAATCDKAGYTTYKCTLKDPNTGKTCTGKWVDEDKKAPALGHKIDKTDYAHLFTKVFPTCTETGILVGECVRCDIMMEEKIPALGHTTKVEQIKGSKAYRIYCTVDDCDYTETIGIEEPEYKITKKDGKYTIALKNEQMVPLTETYVRIAYNLESKNGVKAAIVMCVKVEAGKAFSIPNVQGAMTLKGVNIMVVGNANADALQLSDALAISYGMGNF